jgi:hypothetical protein
MRNLESAELRSNIETGLKKDSTPIIQEIGHILSEDGIKEGATFELYRDEDTIKRISDLLGVDTAIQQGLLHVVSLSITGEHSNSIAGSLMGFAEQTGIVESLPLIQANRWADHRFERIWSNISVGNVIEGDDDLRSVDETKPVISMHAMGVYTVAQQKKFTRLYKEILPEYGKEEATRFTRSDEAKFPAIALKRYIDATESDLQIPIKARSVSVGPAGFGYGTITPESGQKYELKNGRLKLRRY